MTAERGKFVVIYGANNMGKSIQATMLVESLGRKGISSLWIKYPIYSLEPTGPLINSGIRGKEKDRLSDLELQKLFAQNRRDFEPALQHFLGLGAWVVAEDYKGTGIAWGYANGVPLKILEEINADLLPEDVAILLYGERFWQGKESIHRHESEDSVWNKGQEAHLFLADRYGWNKVYATRNPDEVSREVSNIVFEKLGLRERERGSGLKEILK